MDGKMMVAFGCALAALSVTGAAPVVVPAPRSMQVGAGEYVLATNAPMRAFAAMKKGGRVPFVPGSRAAMVLFAKEFGGRPDGSSAAEAAVQFVSAEGIAPEGYRLTVTPKAGVQVLASDAAGFFYAFQTLRQLAERRPDGVAFPCVTIDDAPRFPWRGMMIDDCRHFMGKEAVLKFMEVMAYHKLNVLHWHLTDDQGWRLAIEKYPDLVKYGASRPSSPKHGARGQQDGQVYGPFFYTRADVKEVLARANELHIRVVPEIELPGHARAALAAYPQFSCVGEKLAPREPWTCWGVSEDVYCAGNDDTIKFLEDVLDEVCDLFDSPFIHTGGDECPKTRWNACPKCQARMKANGLKDAHELQSWMVRHFAEYLAKKGRRLVGWDEILEGGLPSGATVMSWRGTGGGIAAAKAGHDVVMSPNHACYFDYGQGLKGDAHEYIGGNVPLATVYAFDPCAGIPAAQRRHVLGGQGNNWSEYTWNQKDLEWKAYPRACALAEALWTAPAERDFGAFLKRMETHRARLLALGVDAAPLK